METSDEHGEIHQLGYEQADRLHLRGFVRIIGWGAIVLGGMYVVRFVAELFTVWTTLIISQTTRGSLIQGLIVDGCFVIASTGLVVAGIQLLRGKMDAVKWVRGMLILLLAGIAVEWILYFCMLSQLSLIPKDKIQLARMVMSFVLSRAQNAMAAAILMAMISQRGIRELTQ